MAKYRKRNYRKRARKPTYRKAVRKAVKTVHNARIKAVIKDVLGKQVETKVLQMGGDLTPRCIQSGTTQTQFDATCAMVSPQGGSLSITQPYPIIGNGVGQDQRIGDECRIKGIYINYILTAKPYDAVFNPTPKACIATVYVVQPKVGSLFGLAVTDIQSGSGAIWFENQANADSGMTGSTIDTLRKIDTDNYRVLYRKTHKIGWAGSLTSGNAVSTFQNNDFKQLSYGRIKLKGWAQKFTRVERQQRQPYYIFCQVMSADGTVQGLSELQVKMSYNETIYFTDM